MPRLEANSPEEYITQLPPDRREAIARTDLDRYLAHYQAARGSSRATRAEKAG